MKTQIKKAIAWMLVLSTMMPLVSCANSTTETQSEPQNTTVATADSSDDTVTEVTEDVFAGLETANLDGTTFTFLTSNWPGEDPWTVDDITSEEMTGSAINDAVYERNLLVEERLNCKVAEYNVDSSGTAVSSLQISVTSGDGAYDVWLPRLHEYLAMGAQGYIMDMNEVEGINFANDAWVKNSIDGLSVLGHSFAVCNELCTIHKEATSCIIFNKALAEDYQLPNLYDVVLEGNWTLDFFETVIKDTSKDLNGDGEMTDVDQWGFLYQRDTLEAFLVAANEAICKKDANDYPIYTFASEGAVSLLMDATDLMYDKTICYNVMNQGFFNEWMTNKMMADEAMFMWVRMVNVPYLRQMENDFGILPNPKYNETIDKYYTAVNDYTGAAVAIPMITNVDKGQYLGLFLETMGAASLNTLSKAYYDVLLNGIVARDEESQGMLDIVFANTAYDAGAIGAYGNIQEYIYMMMNYVQTFSSYNASKKNMVEKSITKLMDKINDRYGN